MSFNAKNCNFSLTVPRVMITEDKRQGTGNGRQQLESRLDSQAVDCEALLPRGRGLRRVGVRLEYLQWILFGVARRQTHSVDIGRDGGVYSAQSEQWLRRTAPAG